MEPSIEPKVPWDRTELQGRECQSCACYFESANPEDPSKFQGFCRRQPADIMQTRGQEPRLDRDKKPVYKDGVPVMNSVMMTGYLFKPTQREGTCFDGYRPKGTLPGERMPALGPKLHDILLSLLEHTGDLVPHLVKDNVRELLLHLTRLR